jgi:hypothetical protein
MSSLSDRVPIPPRDKLNVGLSACTEQTMLKTFGKPGALTLDCSAATGTFKQRIRQSFDVGPFKVTGMDFAVETLLQMFADVRSENPTLFDQVKNEGMLCVRARRHNPAHYSNHSWGTAIDIFFGTDVVPQGLQLAHRGNLLLAPYFNKFGWFWGAGFSGDSIDSMHFELAEETVHKIPDHVMFDSAPAGRGVEAALLGQPVAYRPDPDAARVLGGIVGLLSQAKVVPNNFQPAPRFLATLPGGPLYFDSELQLDTDGWPDGKGRGDPSWQPETSLSYADGTSVDANSVPYFVLPLPKKWPAQFNIKLGDIAAVIFKNKLAFAVFGDEGPKTKLGEGSLELLRQLGEERLRPDGTVINSGMGPGVITIVFPGSGPSAPAKDEATLLGIIDELGKSQFSKLGGLLMPA